MSGLDNEDIERLANRLALLVSDTGEADNAGRAAGAMARRLGLSGGDLKAMFLAGATGRAPQSGRARDRGDDFSAMARQISALQHSLSLVEVSARKAERERDALREENETLRSSLDRRGVSRQVGRIVGSTLVAAALIGGVYTVARPVFRAPAGEASAAPAGAPFAKTAIVRAAGARLYSAANRGAPVITFVPSGTRLTVKRLVVNVLTQWAEVEFAGREGYVATSDVDMP